VAEPASSRVEAVKRHAPTVTLGQSIVQAKLSVGPADDVYEREADAVAARVVRSLAATSAVSSAAEPTGADGSRICRSATSISVADVAQTAPRIGRIRRSTTVGVDGGQLDADTDAAISASRGGGKAMGHDARRKMEGAFGTDFGRIRIHEGSKASELNDRIQAKAFTVGNDIYFRDGAPDTSSKAGQHLLAHELTHTVQQGGRVQRSAEEIQRLGNPFKGLFGSQKAEDPEPGDKPNVITVAVQIKNPELLEFVKLRAKSAFRNKARKKVSKVPLIGRGVRAPKSSVEQKTSTGRRLAQAKHKAANPDAPDMKRHEYIEAGKTIEDRAGTANVGHTWIELDEDPKLSYGLHPIKPGHPFKSVPGIIKNPDVPQGGKIRRMSFPISAEARDRVAAEIEKRSNSGPVYNLMTTNCTTFARDMAKEAGVPFPGGATVIPVGPLGFIKSKLWNPNQLYEDAENSEYLEQDGDDVEMTANPLHGGRSQ
jgi:hypothetical protein